MTAYQKWAIKSDLTVCLAEILTDLTVALATSNQLQFHPVKFLTAVLNDFIKGGANFLFFSVGQDLGARHW